MQAHSPAVMTVVGPAMLDPGPGPEQPGDAFAAHHAAIRDAHPLGQPDAAPLVVTISSTVVTSRRMPSKSDRP